MPVQLVNEIKSTIQPNNHPYMNDAWTPNYREYNATGMEVIGEIPKDIDGVYIRNTENQVHQPIGRYHPFEGDGMIHMMHVENGQAIRCGPA
jgi:carotenoid cleavage dioxygenase